MRYCLWWPQVALMIRETSSNLAGKKPACGLTSHSSLHESDGKLYLRRLAKNRVEEHSFPFKVLNIKADFFLRCSRSGLKHRRSNNLVKRVSQKRKCNQSSVAQGFAKQLKQHSLWHKNVPPWNKSQRIGQAGHTQEFSQHCMCQWNV